MAEPEELLARADDWLENTPAVVHAGTVQLVERLAAALRAALAARPQPPTSECPICHRPFEADGICYGEYHDVARHQIAVAGPAAPTGDDDG